MKRLLTLILIISCILTAVPVMASSEPLKWWELPDFDEYMESQGYDLSEYSYEAVYRQCISDEDRDWYIKFYSKVALDEKYDHGSNIYDPDNKGWGVAAEDYSDVIRCIYDINTETYEIIVSSSTFYRYETSRGDYYITKYAGSGYIYANHDIGTSYSKTVTTTSITEDDVEDNTVSIQEVEVHVDIGAEFTVGIPTHTALDKETGTGNLKTSVQGDLDSMYKLVVTPVDGYTEENGDTTISINFLLEDQSDVTNKKDPIVVDITVGQTEFTYEDIEKDTPVEVNNTLSISSGKLSAGKWRGVIRYSISLEEIVEEQGSEG